MSLYLANKDTESILFKPVKVGIQDAYRDFRKVLDQNYRLSSGKPVTPTSMSPDVTTKGSSPLPDTGSSVIDLADDDDEDIRIIACPESEELNLLLASIISTANSAMANKTTIPAILPWELSGGKGEIDVGASS